MPCIHELSPMEIGSMESTLLENIGPGPYKLTNSYRAIISKTVNETIEVEVGYMKGSYLIS